MMIAAMAMAATVPPPAASTAALPAIGRSAAPPTYGFGGALLGETFDAWRADRPGQAPTGCESSRKAGVRVVVCTGPPIPLGASYAARSPTCTFVDGRLASITFRSSIDGFSFVTARLKSRFGPPGRIVRDTTELSDHLLRDHVRMIWRSGGGSITLDDPLRDGASLGVRIADDAHPTHS